MTETARAAHVGAKAATATDRLAEQMLARAERARAALGEAYGSIEGKVPGGSERLSAEQMRQLGASYDRSYLDKMREQTVATNSEQEIERLRKYQEFLIQQMQDGFVIEGTGPDGGVTFANGRFGGFTRTKVTTTSDYRFVKDPASIGDARLKAAYMDELKGKTYRERGAELLGRMVGFREGAGNTGAVPALFGCSGLPWCGGSEQGMDARITGGQLYNQKEFRLASSFGALAAKYGGLVAGKDIDPSNPDTWPKVFDTIILPGAGISGQHPATVKSIDPRTGMMTLVAGNHGNKIAEFKMPITSARILGYVSKDKVLQGKAKAGEAVIGLDGMPMLSLDQVAPPDQPPHQWVAQFYSDPARVAAARALGKAMTEGKKIDGVDIAAVVVQLRGDQAAFKKFDRNGDGQITIADIKGVTQALRDKGITLSTTEYGADGVVDSLPEYIAAMKQHGDKLDPPAAARQ